MPRMLALDLDGTLLDSEGTLRPVVRDAVRAAAEKMHVLVCTGRRYRGAKTLLDELGLRGPVVTQNGTMVRDSVSAKTLKSTTLTADVAIEALALMRELTPPLVFVDDYENGVDIISEPLARLHDVQRTYLSHVVENANLVENLQESHLQAPLMLSCMADRQQVAALENVLRQRLGERIHTHLIAHKNYPGHIVEVLPPNASKWYALSHIAKSLGIKNKDIMAIGDDHNDAMMLEHAGIGVAMGNAMPGVADFANEITATNDEDGAALAIRRLALGERI